MKGIMRSFFVSLWFMALTFPLLVIKITPRTGEITWRWKNIIYLGVGVFVLSFVWRAASVKKGLSTPKEADMEWLFNYLASPQNKNRFMAALALVIGCIPSLFAFAGGETPSLPAFACLGAGLAAAFFVLTGKSTKITTLFGQMSEKIQTPSLLQKGILAIIFVVLAGLAFTMNSYQINVLSQTLIWVMLGLGLNIVVGQAGMLILGYVAFYAVGAYTYAVFNNLFGSSYLGFWICLPLGGLFAALAGIALSLPVLRLRGDYLAIVTLGFGEIVRVILQGGSMSLAPVADFLAWVSGKEMPEWMSAPLELGGPAGISGIPSPSFFGVQLNMDQRILYIYFIALTMTALTIIAVARFRDSRLGRSWAALREDEIACESMGINKVSAKLTAFALGACWAGFGGVLFAAKTSFINPSSFTFMESALILSVVVLGGLGSILGVILGACVLILLPEYLRSFDEYRMLIFGASMVLMMVFRPQGLITPRPRRCTIPESTAGGAK